MKINFDNLIIDDGRKFLVNREIFKSEEIFELEKKYIFESTWNLIGLTSQLRNPYDYFTTYIMDTPIIITKDKNGELYGLINSCRHKGPMVCHKQSGNARAFVCRYHGWTYGIDGKNIKIKDEDYGQYPDFFQDLDHSLRRIKLQIYRDFIFASLKDEPLLFDDYIKELCPFLDMIIDQAGGAIECIPGNVRYYMDANWKFQLENGSDAYHFTSTHNSYIKILNNRKTNESAYSTIDVDKLERGTFSLGHGHNILWGPIPNISARSFTAGTSDKWRAYTRNLTIFPNAQIVDNASMQLRIWRPISAGITEIRTYCLAPTNENKQDRINRIRRYEEFFNPTGFATPDDIANYEDGQRGILADQIIWQQGHQRGSLVKCSAVTPDAVEIGSNPISSTKGGFRLGDETVMQDTYRTWLKLIKQGLIGAVDVKK